MIEVFVVASNDGHAVHKSSDGDECIAKRRLVRDVQRCKSKSRLGVNGEDAINKGRQDALVKPGPQQCADTTIGLTSPSLPQLGNDVGIKREQNV